LYLLKDSTTPGDVFKIGRTCDLKRRLSRYPTGSYYLFTCGCLVDCHDFERRLIAMFNQKFDRFKGLEYFRGSQADVFEAIRSFCYDDPSPMQC
jgi:hypothetical protein